MKSFPFGAKGLFSGAFNVSFRVANRYLLRVAKIGSKSQGSLVYLVLPWVRDVGVSNTFELVLGNRALVCFLIFQEVDCKIHDCCFSFRQSEH